MFGNLGFWEILLIILIVAILFGGKKLPQVGKGLGEAINQFKDAIKGDKNKEPKIEDKNIN
ncbi:MAG: twin-arginine translocase TatA/TatE family subunit [Candidatus Omnitrophota bacterium]